MAQSVRAGRILDLPSLPTLSDGTAGGVEADTITFALCRDYVDHWIEVSEEEVADAMRLFIDAHHMLLEGAGGVAIAGALRVGEPWTSGRSLIVICGANIGRSTLKSVL
jgi:threonine dehydratase